MELVKVWYHMKNYTFSEKIRIIGIIFMLFFLSYNIIRDIIKQPEQKGILDSLKIEFNKISKLPSASRVDERYTCFTGKTSIEGTYATSTSDYEVQIFYNEQLVKNGWKLIDERKMYDWGKDLGGKMLTYRKSNILLNMQFAGEKAGYGWAYAISLKMKE